MNVCEHLSGTAAIVPDRIAIRFESVDYTYSQLNQLSMAASQILVDFDVQPGDRVALMLPNVPAFAVWYFAAVRIGAIAVSVSTRSAAAEVAFLVGDCEASVFVADDTTLQNVKAELPPCIQHTACVNDTADVCNDASLDFSSVVPMVNASADDAAVILYTSGTTGFAKGATLSHGNVRSNVHAFNHLCNMQSDDRILLAVPLFHCFGQNALLNSAFNAGATLVLQRRFDLNESKRLIADEKVTQLYGVPMMFQLFLDSCSPADLESVTYCFSAAATLPLQIANRWAEKFGMPIYEGYGLTETSPFASYNHRLKFVPGSIGTAIDNCELKIVDTDTGEECGPGQLGEIVIKGPNVMLGYWNRKEETQQAIRNGWFHSGDIGKTDERGFFYLVDRVKDMIAVGGLKVFPAEVERILLDHDSVSEVAVVGIADAVFGEQVVAYVVLNTAAGNKTATDNTATDHTATDNTVAQLESIREFAKLKLANYKQPRMLVPVSELPRNPSGKVLKRELRERNVSQQILTSTAATTQDSVATDSSADHSVVAIPTISGADSTNEGVENLVVVSSHQLQAASLKTSLLAAHPVSRSGVALEFVQHLVQTIGDLDALPDADEGFLAAGMDSLMIVEMSNQIQVELGDDYDVPTTLIFDHPRICDLSSFLLTALCPEADSEPVLPQVAEKPKVDLKHQVDQMTDDEALIALMKELEDS